MFSSRRRSWFTLRRISESEVVYFWPHPLARRARKFLDCSLYLPWVAK